MNDLNNFDNLFALSFGNKVTLIKLIKGAARELIGLNEDEPDLALKYANEMMVAGQRAIEKILEEGDDL